MDADRRFVGHFDRVQRFFHPYDSVPQAHFEAAIGQFRGEAVAHRPVEGQRCLVAGGDQGVDLDVALGLQEGFQFPVESLCDASALGLRP